MAAFDAWVTDPDVTLRGVQSFTADVSRVGERFLERYAVWTTSGTSGEAGIFVHDPGALAVYAALHRSLAHVSYHVGQIVFLARMSLGPDWDYLSIPPGHSAAYNENPTLESGPRETPRS